MHYSVARVGAVVAMGLRVRLRLVNLTKGSVPP